MKLHLLTFAFSVAISLAAAAPARAETVLGEIAKAEALRDKGDFDGAIDLWSAWLKKGLTADSAFNAYFFRGIARRDKGDNDGAIVDFTRAIELHPKEANTYSQRGDTKLDKGDIEGAMADYTKAIELNPTFVAYYFQRGNTKLDKGDIEGAMADFNSAIELKPEFPFPVAYFYRGNAKSAKGDKEGAMADYTRAIELNPKDANAYLKRGNVKSDIGDREGAMADFTRAIELNPKHAVAYYNRGSAKRAKGDPEGAIADYTHAIELNPKDADAYFSRGVALYLQQSWLKASGDFDMASRQEKPADYGLLLACVLQTRLGQGEAGRKVLGLRLAARRDAEPGAWFSSLGRFLLGTRTEAELLRAADALDAQKARAQRCEAWYYAGMQRLAAGQKAEARSCFLKCLATEQKGFIEYIFATAELKWLGER